MKQRHYSQTYRHRVTAWLLLFVCLWMGTDGVMRHTDAAPNSRSASAQAVFGHPALAAPPADACAACEWTQGMQTGPLTLCLLPAPLTPLDSPLLIAGRKVDARPLRHRASRAPPTSFE